MQMITRQTLKHSKGFTLIELMITIGIIGALAAIAVPAYTGYIETAAKGTVQANAESLAGFVDMYFYENETYVAGTYDPPGTDTLTAALAWKPSGDKDLYKYEVVAGATGIATSYKLTVTYKKNTAITAILEKP